MQCPDRCHQQRETARAASSQEPPGAVEGRTLSPCTWIPLPQYAAGFIVELAFLLKSVILLNNSKESNLEAKQKYSCSLPLP